MYGHQWITDNSDVLESDNDKHYVIEYVSCLVCGFRAEQMYDAKLDPWGDSAPILTMSGQVPTDCTGDTSLHHHYDGECYDEDNCRQDDDCNCDFCD